jgi:hypothetical protein
MSEIVYAAGEGPSAPTMAPPRMVADRKPVKMSRAKIWNEEVEENYRFQQAMYRDEEEYRAYHPNEDIPRWPSGYIKKLQRKDGYWNYFNKSRELYKNLHLVKMYQYE